MPEDQIGVTGQSGVGEGEQVDDAAGGTSGSAPSGGGAQVPMIYYFAS